jgi:biopolymer transport protein ExbD
MMPVRDRDKFEEIKPDMTPMIDVTFLLLIFFIVTLKFKTLEGRLDSNLPKDMGTMNTTVEEIEKVDIVIMVGSPGQLMPDKSTQSPSFPQGRLNMFRGRILKISVGTTVFQVRTDVLDPEGLFADLAKLRRALTGIDREETPVTLDAREAVVYGDIIGILDLIIDEEFKKVSFTGAPEQG